MPTYTQEHRRLAIETPLGTDVLLLTGLNGAEELSRPFSLYLELLSDNDSIAPKSIVGHNVTMAVELLDGSQRYFNGYVKSFANIGRDDRLSHYTAEVVPWLWFLTRRSDCRIFQEKSVPQIIEAVFCDLGFTDYKLELNGNYPPREYCVQYRETDFDFVSRLMEEEGIFYTFHHENGKHTMLLADTANSYKPCAERDVSFGTPINAQDWGELVTSWEHRWEYRSGKWSHTDYNFETPSTSLRAECPSLVQLTNIDKFEQFEYPGGYGKRDEGDSYAKRRMEEEEAGYDVVHGASRCRTFFAGGTFTMASHNTASEEGLSYVVTGVTHSISARGAYETGGSEAPAEYSNQFTCIPDSVTFRPPRRTPRPIVHGSQTAIVVGPSGEEIYTDKYGRVKVQFHWDRYGKADEKSSCWVRVAQVWAGHNWGAMHIPRITQEVIVDFLEGDPDRPIITGRVYHAASMPPYPLPDNATMSTMKSMSSKGGGGFNEIRFEDKKGEEQIFIHGEKNHDTRIKNDCFEWIGNNRHLIVVKDQKEDVQNNRHEKVANDHIEEIGKDRHLKVVGKEAKEVGGSHSFTVKGDVIEAFKGKQTTQVTGDLYIKGMNVVIEASTNLTLKVGGNSVVLSPAGVVVTASAMLGLNGNPVLINSGGTGAAGTGQAASAVAPTVPEAAEEADDADPGEVAKVKAEQLEQEQGKYGAVPIQPHKPPTTEEKQTKTSWIEIELVGEDDKPIPGERYRIKLPDDTVAEGSLDEKGFARVDGFEPGTCQVCFPKLDQEAWEPA